MENFKRRNNPDKDSESLLSRKKLDRTKSKTKSLIYQDETVSIGPDESCEMTKEKNKNSGNHNNLYGLNVGNNCGINFPTPLNYSEELFSQYDIAGQLLNYSNIHNYNNLNFNNGSNFYGSYAGYPYGSMVRYFNIS